MKKITNPTDKDISIQLDGNVYEVEAKGTLDISNDEHADRWVRTHRFLTCKKIENMEEDKVTEETSTEEEAVEEEVAEDAPEEVSDEDKKEIDELVEEKK